MVKEVNRARAAGVLPFANADPIPVGKIPDGATQVIKFSSAINAVAIIHTVTPDKTLYLTYFTCLCHNNAGVVRTLSLAVRNTLDVLRYFLVESYMLGNGYVPFTGSLLPPLEITGGDDIYVSSNGENSAITATIHGYEI